MTEHARPTTSTGNGLKITLTSGIIIAALVASVGWGLQVQLALATKADGEQVKVVAKEEAAAAAASKAEKNDVVRLQVQVEQILAAQVETNKKLDRLLEKR